MCLLDAIVSWDAQHIELIATTHQSPNNPLRSPDGRLRSLHLCEYGAQAMAVHGALTARAAGRQPKPGFLVAVRAVQLHCDFLDDIAAPLEVEARCLLATAESWQYAFSVRSARLPLAEGRAAVVARPERGG